MQRSHGESIMKINAQFQTYWHIGTGTGSGQSLDALVDKDNDKLPHIPGKMLKGLFRDAMYKLEQWGHISKGTTNRLFGSYNEETHLSTSGCLHFPSLTLSNEEINALNNHETLKSFLYHNIASTSINPETGTAQEGSLRMMEAAIPICLSGEISLINNQDNQDDWQNFIKDSSDFVTNIGANKSRGFGQVKWTFE